MIGPRHRIAIAVTATVAIAVDVVLVAGGAATLELRPIESACCAGLCALVPAWVVWRSGAATSVAAGCVGLAAWQLPALVAGAPIQDRIPDLAACAVGLFAAALAAIIVVTAELAGRRHPRIARTSPALPLVAVTAWLACGEFTAEIATSPRPDTAPPPGVLADARIEALSVRTVDDARIDAWLVNADPRSCVLLLAGIHGNRRILAPRARYWLDRGHSVLIPDLRGTGTSEPTQVTFGWDERHDVRALWAELAARGFTSIGVHAQSLGAAAFCYANREGLDPAPRFAVLDAVYDDLRHALFNRLPMVPLPDTLLWPVVAAAERRLGAPAAALRPIDAIRTLRAPTLLVQGTEDRKVGPTVPAALLSASPASIKEIAWLQGLGHVDLWGAAEARYRRALTAFLARLH